MCNRFVILVLLGVLGSPALQAQTVADFSATPTSGVQALSVQFTNLSTSDAAFVIFSWDFGDGTTDVGTPQPTHVYEAPGSYGVSLTATPFPVGAPSTETKLDFIVVTPGVLDVDIGASPTAGPLPLEVEFQALALGSAQAAGWTWDFGDGATSSQQHPSHTYTAAGTYDVSLTTSLDGQTVEVSAPGLIAVSAPELQPSFSAEPATLVAGSAVSFSDTSGGSAPDGWCWDFGDGSTSTQQHPQHVYLLGGSYDVSLTVSLLGWSETVTVPGAVVVDVPDLQPSFRWTPEAAKLPAFVQFTDTSTASPGATRLWSFGDGQASTDADPLHIYTSQGGFDVTLTLTLGGYEAAHTEVAAVHTLWPDLQASFEAFPRGGLAPLAAAFTETSSSDVPTSSLLWFGDGAWEDDPSPGFVHVYPNPGHYSPSLDLYTSPSTQANDSVTEARLIEVVDPANLSFAHLAAPVELELGMQPYGMRAADIDADGLLDLVVNNNQNVCVLFNAGGSFPGPKLCTHEPWADGEFIGVGDLTSDGFPDLVWRSRDGFVSSPPEVQVFVGDGAGAFTPLASVEVPISGNQDTTWGLLADPNEDGRLDVLVGLENGSMQILYGDGAGGLELLASSPGSALFDGVPPWLVDFDGDGTLDLMGPDGNSFTAPTGFYLYAGDGSAYATTPQFVPTSGFPAGLDVGDVNGDGWPDALISLGSQTQLALGNGSGLDAFVVLPGVANLSELALADFDLDGDDDLIGYAASGSAVHRVDGAGGAELSVTVGGGATGYLPFDIDGDGDHDLVTRLPPDSWPNLYAKRLLIQENLGTAGEWVDIGGAMSGAGGAPQLDGSGDLVPGQPIAFSLGGAAPNAAAWFVIGLSDLSQPFKGGVLVPQPDVVLAGLVTSPAGGFELPTLWPPGVPAGTLSWYQVWISESGGFVGSNGLLGVSGE